MADVLNRTTLELRKSVNTPDYDPAVWIINPDLSAVSGHPVSHWSVNGDVVSLKSEAEREAADILVAKSAKRDEIVAAWARQAAQGIDLGDFVVKSDITDAVQLEALRSSLADDPDGAPTIVTDIYGIPRQTTAGRFRELAAIYEQTFTSRRADSAAAILAMIQATTLAEVAAVEVPVYG